MADCLLTGISEDQARINLLTYIRDSFVAAPVGVSGIELIYPNAKPPDTESRTTPFIMLSIRPVHSEQSGMGESTFVTTKTLDISLWIREYTGIKIVGLFVDFVKSLGLKTVDSISYGVPHQVVQKPYKGWEVNPVFLPIRF
jgi:hypothetical protein